MLAFCLNFCVLPKFFYCAQNRSQSLGRSLSLLRAQKLARVFATFTAVKVASVIFILTCLINFFNIFSRNYDHSTTFDINIFQKHEVSPTLTFHFFSISCAVGSIGFLFTSLPSALCPQMQIGVLGGQMQSVAFSL